MLGNVGLLSAWDRTGRAGLIGILEIPDFLKFTKTMRASGSVKVLDIKKYLILS